MTEPGPNPGETIAGRFRLERLLGEGGMGSVWAATHLLMGSEVALKFLRPELTTSPELVRRFMREARAAGAIRHPNVLKVHDVLQREDGTPFMVMDLLVGESLDAKMRREGVLPLGELTRLLLPVVSALGTAHALGIVHRDLKPDNIFLERSAGEVVPRVLDFGIAKITGQLAAETKSGGAALTRTGAMLGTPYYMAPEQAFGERNADHRVDVWSMGIILYQALSGRRPVDGENLGQILRVIMTGNIVSIDQVAPHLPEDVRELIRRMLSTRPDDRPFSMQEIADVLHRYTDAHAETFGAPIAARPMSEIPSAIGDDTPSPVSQTGREAVTEAREATRRKWTAVIALTVLVLATVPIALILALRGEPSTGSDSAIVSSTSADPTVLMLAPDPRGAPEEPADAASSASAEVRPDAAPPSTVALPKSTGTPKASATPGGTPPAATPPAATPPAPPGASAGLPWGIAEETPF